MLRRNRFSLPFGSIWNWAKPTGWGPRLAATAAIRPSGTRDTVKTSPSHGSNFTFDPVSAKVTESAASVSATVALPKIGLTKVPTNGARGGVGRGFGGLAKSALLAASAAWAAASFAAT